MSALGEPVVDRGRLPSPVAFILAAATLYGQSPSVTSEYIAFRVDADHVVATVLVRDVNLPQVHKGLSPVPVAQFGYQYFEPPDYWGDLRTDHNVGDRWLIQTAPGQVLHATVERRVGGYLSARKRWGFCCVLPHSRRRHSARFTRVTLSRPRLQQRRRMRPPFVPAFERCLPTP